jgi:glycogen operon protein
MVRHFRTLGVTAVELIPVHQLVHDSTLAERGLSNYWGYNTIGFFAPHNNYACFGTRGEQVLESKTMLRALPRPASRSSTTTPPRATTSARVRHLLDRALR